MAFALAIALACGVVFGLAPSFSNASVSSRHRLRHVLAIAQVAVSLTLLVSAWLLVKSLRNLQNVNAGTGAERVVTADITIGPAHHPNAQSRQEFFETLAARLRTMPGIEAVALSDTVPPSGFVHSKPLSSVQVVGRPASEREPGGIVTWRRVSADYFRALGIPMLQGRSFREEELASNGAPAVVISKSLARKVFPGESAMGRAIHLYRDPLDFPPPVVIGVCGDVPNNGLSQAPDPEYYLPRMKITDPNQGRDIGLVGKSLHRYDGEAFLIVRGAARPDAMANWIRAAAAALDRTAPVTIGTMQQRLHAVSERPRFTAALLSLFALVGVLLAAGGLYGLISFLVIEKTRELGIRLAIGATPKQIIQLVLSHVLRWSLAGIGAGLVGATVAARWLQSLLFQVHAENPLFFFMASLFMIAVAILARAGAFSSGGENRSDDGPAA